ncbi:MAG: UDP-2,3-diacylglucosamine diphosphatase LpxI, partial [Rhizobiales bacterium]|nr:UDP-2,3-diacylglucosamine diphosphatase LpxI [Hyphomicrobiales bacterium]
MRAGEPVAILAGGGRLPFLVGAAAAKAGREPIVIAIAGEAEPAGFAPLPVHLLHWGEIGRLFRLLEESGCREAVLIGSILKRPDFHAIRPDLGAVKLIPRILRLMRRGDNGLLSGVAEIFEDHGVQILSPLDVAPDLALPQGLLFGGAVADARHDIDQALDAARAIGRLDVGQGAVAVRGRVVATEDAGGTDALLR